MSASGAVVVHVTSGESTDWRTALRNLSNLYRDESVPTPADALKVVVNGDAVRFLLSAAPEAGQVTRIAEAGVQFNACANSLERLGHDPADLAEGVTTVPSGVAEVVRLQQRDVAYLKLP